MPLSHARAGREDLVCLLAFAPDRDERTISKLLYALCCSSGPTAGCAAVLEARRLCGYRSLLWTFVGGVYAYVQEADWKKMAYRTRIRIRKDVRTLIL